MVIVGEKLNSSVPSAMQAFTDHDAQTVLAIAQAQAEGGANYLDINAAMMPDEQADLLWAVQLLADSVAVPLMIDTPSPNAAAYVYEHVPLEGSIINSVTLEPDRLDGMLDIVTQYNTGVVALPVSSSGMPRTADERVELSRELIARISERGVAHDRIYVDLLVEAAAADSSAPLASIDAAKQLRAAFPDVHLIGGLSNVSFGLPQRSALNAAFLCCLMSAGADAFILDPTRRSTMLAYHACRLMLGDDEYCMEYITYCRSLAEQ